MSPRKTHTAVISATLTMLVAAFLLAVLVFVFPAPALADTPAPADASPNLICTCCRSFLFCRRIAETHYCSPSGTLYNCQGIDECYDNCCTTLAGKWAWKGCNCSYIGYGCTPRGDIQPCGVFSCP